MGGDLGLDGMTPGGLHAPTPHPPSRAEKTLTKQIVVRVPTSLYEALQKDAADHGRTPAQSVRFLLTKALA